MSYRDSTLAIADASESATLRVFRNHDVFRDHDEATFIVLAPGIVAGFMASAVALADLSLAAYLRKLPLGLEPPDERGQLIKTFTTLTDEIRDYDPPIAEAKVSRLARAEPLHIGRVAYRDAALRRGLSGWTREASPTACELCLSLADGTVLSWDTLPVDHPGCACVQVPVN